MHCAPFLAFVINNNVNKVCWLLNYCSDYGALVGVLLSLKQLNTQRADQRKTAMYRGSNRIQIAARVNIMRPKKFGDHHRDENLDYRRDGGVQKGNCDNYLHLAIHFSGQYPRAKIFCTRMFYFPVTH